MDKNTSTNVVKLKQKPFKAKIMKGSYLRYKPRIKDYFINDTKHTGYCIRVCVNGAKTYCVNRRIGGVGTPRRIKIGDCETWDEKEAREVAKKYIVLMDEGVHPVEEKKKKAHEEFVSGITFQDLFEDYLQIRDLKESTKVDFRNKMNHASHLMNTQVKKISDGDILKIWKKLRDESKYVTAEGFLVVIKAILNWAVKRKYLEDNPAEIVRATVGSPKKKDQIKNHISFLNLKSFLENFITLSEKDFKHSEFLFPVLEKNERLISSNMRDWILFMLVTGTRVTESSTLKWQDVDLDGYTMFFPETKSGRVFKIPMTNLIWHMMKWRKQNQINEYVFSTKFNNGTHVNDCRKPLIKISKHAKLDQPLTPHALRRTFGTLADEAGLSMEEIGSLMNHATRSVTENYVVRRLSATRNSLDEIEEIINSQSDGLLGLIKTIWYGGDERWFSGFSPPLEHRKLEDQYYY